MGRIAPFSNKGALEKIPPRRVVDIKISSIEAVSGINDEDVFDLEILESRFTFRPK